MFVERIKSLIKSLSHLKIELGALLVLLIYLCPYIINIENTRFLIHDGLECIITYKNLVTSGKMFMSNDLIIPNNLGGIPRGCYPSELNLMILSYIFFQPLKAYCINIVFTHLLAFFSMYIFLKSYLLNKENNYLRVFISLLFSLLPFWPHSCASIAGQPLLLYAFLNIYLGKKSIFNYIIILIIPFYSNLAISNLFFVSLLGILFLGHSLYNKKLPWQILSALLLFALVSVITEYRLFMMQFIEKFESHREGLVAAGNLNYKGVIGVSLKHFLYGQYHFYSMHSPFIILILIGSFILGSKWNRKLLSISVLSVLLISFSFVVKDWRLIQEYINNSNLLSKLSLRYYSLFPLIWFLLLAFGCKIIVDSKRPFMVPIMYIALILQLFNQVFSVFQKDYQGYGTAENAFFNTHFNKVSTQHDTYSSFTKQMLFSEVSKQIPKGTKVACIGFNPLIAQFNGYYTIEGYYNYYPKKNKLFIDRINRKEIKRPEQNRSNSRLNIISKDLDNGLNIISNPEWDFKLMDSLNVNYIFSIKKIISDKLISKGSFGMASDSINVYSIVL